MIIYFNLAFVFVNGYFALTHPEAGVRWLNLFACVVNALAVLVHALCIK